MKRGEIWLVGLDPTMGHEQEGRRPVLIVSAHAFNLRNESARCSSDHECRKFRSDSSICRDAGRRRDHDERCHPRTEALE